MAWWLLIGTWISLLATSLIGCSSGNSSSLPIYNEVPVFSLTNQNGHVLTNSDLSGKVILANFVFTNCTQYCLTLSPRMSQIQESLSDGELLGDQVILLSFSMDPENDTPETLLSYANTYGANHDMWQFLTGPADSMRELITGGFKLGFQKVNQNKEHHHDDGSIHIHEYDILHTNRVILWDKKGRVRAYYDGALDWDMATILRDIGQLAD